MPSEESPSLGARVLLYVGALAAIVRLLYLTEHASAPLFAYPVLDERYYETVARLLHQGESLAAINPGFRPLLYPILLSLFQRFGEMALPTALFFQHLLGVVNSLLIAALAFRLSRSDIQALVAAGLFILAGPPLYFEGQILLTTVATSLNLALVFFLTTLPRRATGWWPFVAWALSGSLLGLAVQARPNVVLFALAWPLAWWVFARRGRGLDPRFPLAAAGGLLVCLAGFAALHQPHFGHFQLLPGSGGVNFYLGNKQGADGMVPRQDRRVTYGDEYRDSVQVFAREEYARSRGVAPAAVSADEVSRYWLRRAGREILDDPGAWLGLMLRKTWFLLWNREVPNNKSYDFVLAEESRLLRLLPVRWWLLVALTPLGVVWCRRHGNRWAFYWLASFIALWSAGLLLFFVNGRYRAPLWPFLCVLAASGLALIGRQVAAARREGRWRPLALSGACFAAYAAVSLVNWLVIGPVAFDREFFYRSVAQLDRGDLDEAAADAARSVALEPGEPMYLFQQGNVHLARDEFGQAAAAYRRAGELKPIEPRIWNNLGLAEERLGNPQRAIEAYRRAIAQVGDYSPARTNAALLELRAGRPDEAERHLAATAAAGDDSVFFLCARAFLARARNDVASADRLLAEARRRDPAITTRLEREARQPVTLDPPSD